MILHNININTIQGAFYINFHAYSSYIAIQNVSIHSNQLVIDGALTAIFNFADMMLKDYYGLLIVQIYCSLIIH